MTIAYLHKAISIKLYLLFFLLLIPSIGLTQTSQAPKVLLIGNSYLFSPGNPVRPTLKVELEKISDKHKKTQKFNVTAFTKPGFTLKQHFQQPRLIKLLKQQWDYVIIQGQSLATLDLPPRQGPPFSDFLDYGKKIIDQISSKARIYLFAHWIRSKKAQFTWKGSDQSYQDKINSGYQKLATKPNTEVLKVGDTWRKLLTSANTPFASEDLYTSDGSHPTYFGTYVNAAIIFNKISGQSALDSSHQHKNLSKQKFIFLKSKL